jgi:hypothetical protein
MKHTQLNIQPGIYQVNPEKEVFCYTEDDPNFPTANETFINEGEIFEILSIENEVAIIEFGGNQFMTNLEDIEFCTKIK